MRPAGDAAPGSRRVALPDQRLLIVRPSTPGDVDGLAALYAGLSADDLHTRFFTVYHPPRKFFEQLVGVAHDGGYGLVAVVADRGERIVADAEYYLLDNGNGELAITVAADWRGWLGPYMLDALIEAAAARGVPNLEALILVENHPMLALVRRLGYATVDGTDYGTLRLCIGTTTAVPTWAGPRDRPRVLAEVPGGRWRSEGAVRAAGMQVMACPGPRPRWERGCPALRGKPCPLAGGADVVVCALPPGLGDEVRAAHAVLHPRVPILTTGHITDPSEADDAMVAQIERAMAEGSTEPLEAEASGPTSTVA